MIHAVTHHLSSLATWQRLNKYSAAAFIAAFALEHLAHVWDSESKLLCKCDQSTEETGMIKAFYMGLSKSVQFAAAICSLSYPSTWIGKIAAAIIYSSICFGAHITSREEDDRTYHRMGEMVSESLNIAAKVINILAFARLVSRYSKFAAGISTMSMVALTSMYLRCHWKNMRYLRNDSV